MFFHWLFSLLICAAFAAYIVKPDWTLGLYNKVASRLTQTQVVAIGIAILALFVILTVVQACIIFKRGKKKDRGFITVDSSDTGKVRIAVSAIEQMVRQSVTCIDGITDMKIGIENLDDAIAINIVATLQNGCHVPTVTVNMQRAIRQFVEMNCGVAVRSVSISINAVSASGEGGRRGRRRKDEVKPVVTPAPVAAPPTPSFEKPEEKTVFEPDPEPRNEPDPEPEPEQEPEDEPVFIPDPEPIRLHFDHLPETPVEEIDEDDEAPETVEEQ